MRPLDSAQPQGIDDAFRDGSDTLVDGVVNRALGARQSFIKPHCPWQNGKVKRFNRTLQVEWAYRQVFTSNTARAQALAPWLEH